MNNETNDPAAPLLKACAVHGGTNWRGGYCDRWSTDTGKGPCVETNPIVPDFDPIVGDERDLAAYARELLDIRNGSVPVRITLETLFWNTYRPELLHGEERTIREMLAAAITCAYCGGLELDGFRHDDRDFCDIECATRFERQAADRAFAAKGESR